MTANYMSSEWLSRLQSGQCDGDVIGASRGRDSLSRVIRETPPDKLDRNRWAFRDAVVSFEIQKA